MGTVVICVLLVGFDQMFTRTHYFWLLKCHVSSVFKTGRLSASSHRSFSSAVVMASLALTNGYAKLCDQLKPFPKTVSDGEYTSYQVVPNVDGVNNVELHVYQPADKVVKLVLNMEAPVYEAFVSKIPVTVVVTNQVKLDVSEILDSGTPRIVRATRFMYRQISILGHSSVTLVCSLSGKDMTLGTGSAVVATFVDVVRQSA